MKQVVELTDIEDSIRNENGTFYFEMRATIKTDPDKWVGKGIDSYFGTRIGGSRMEIKFIPKEEASSMTEKQGTNIDDRYFLCRMQDGKTVTIRMVPYLAGNIISDVVLLSQSTLNVDSADLLAKAYRIREHFLGKTMKEWREDALISGL